MNKFTLKFEDKSLENEYQTLKTQKIRKPLFYGLFVFCYGLNLFKIISDLINQSQYPLYINYFYVAMMSILMILCCKNKKYIKRALMVANILSGLLQLNFDGENTSKQEFYSYGGSFAQLQAVSYFVSDFIDGVIQVIAHTSLKITITSYANSSINVLCLMFAITGALFTLITIYICDQNSRRYYLSSVIEDIWDQQFPYLIKKPFMKISYKDTIINILNSHNIDKIPGYTNNECHGCNGRAFLRNCYLQQDGINLQQAILSQLDILNKTVCAHIKGSRFNLRICKFGVETMNRFVIIDKIITKTETKQLPQILYYDLSKQIRQSPNEPIRYFNWGLLSFILLNNFTIREVNLFKMLKKLNNAYRKHLLPIQIIAKTEDIKITTYVNLLRIFLIQLYQIILELHQKCYRPKIQIRQCTDYVELHILQSNPTMFQLLYKRNMFIQTIQRIILYNEMGRELRIQLSQQIPFTF